MSSNMPFVTRFRRGSIGMRKDDVHGAPPELCLSKVLQAPVDTADSGKASDWPVKGTLVAKEFTSNGWGATMTWQS